MERVIKRVEFGYVPQEKVLRVAAYARVSSGKDAMLHSLSAQVSHYSNMIQSHKGWVYCGVYSDEAFTGTKENRDGFQTLLQACRDGKIDMVITKSISRFARNTVTLLATVRELKGIGVDVFFEEQGIHTMSAEGELMLTILASFAQEESRSASENQKWRIKRNFEKGIPWRSHMLGYRLDGDKFRIVPEEAELVRRVFRDYLSGLGNQAIANRLQTEGIAERFERSFCKSEIGKILSNYAYTGNLLLQKTYTGDHITKRTYVNQGERPMYHAEDCHEPIVTEQMFRAVQEEKERRAKKHKAGVSTRSTYPFTGLLQCANCRKNYRRKITHGGPVWICNTFNTQGKVACPSKQIPETILTEVTAGVLGVKTVTKEMLRDKVTSILACNGNRLIYKLSDGREVERTWQNRSRADSWTPEMKAAARARYLEGGSCHA